MLASARCCGGRGLSACRAGVRGAHHDRRDDHPARRRAFPGSGDQVARARLFVGQVLGGCPAADDAVLLTSELVTNAVTHTASGTGGKVVVTVYRLIPGSGSRSGTADPVRSLPSARMTRR